MVRRLAWGREKINWRQQQWRSCLFTDESRFCLKPCNKRLRKWRRRGERRNDPNVVNNRELYGGGGIMVWGGIRHNGKTDLVIIEGNLNAIEYRAILDDHVLPEDRAVGANFVLVDDNARPHRGAVVDEYLARQGITRMNWPAKSPDLNPIENVWSVMKHNISQRLTPNSTMADLRRMVLEEWQGLTMQFINRLVRSMNTRARQVVRYRGSFTDY